MKQPASIQRFFNDVGPIAGPLELLGVDPLSCTEESVRDALKRRLDRLQLNPLAGSPEAEEVRLALHVAAAQLIDPAVRAALLEERRLTREVPTAISAPLPAGFDATAFAAVASAGGWNREARRRLAAVAASQGIAPREAAGRIVRLAQSKHDATKPAGEVIADRLISFNTDAAVERRSLRRWGSFALLILLIASTVLIAIRLVTIAGHMAPATPSSEAEDVAESTEVEPTEASESQEPAVAPRTGAAPSPIITPSRHPGAAMKTGDDAPVAPRAPLSEPVLNLIAQAETLLADPQERDVLPSIRLAKAVQLARLNLAARRLWQGDQVAAERALRDSAKRPNTPSSPMLLDAYRDPAALTAPGVEPDGTLALEIWALRRKPGQGIDAFRNRRFTHLNLGPVDCDAVAETALFGSPQDLRLVARRIVTDQKENPAMVNALLESLPRASRQSPLSALIVEISDRTLPEIDDPAWPARARGALIERLAELLSPGVRPGIDVLAEMLAAAYAGKDADSVSESSSDSPVPGPMRTTPDSSAPQPPPLTSGPIPAGDSRGGELAAEALRRSWVDEASAYRALRSVAQRLDALGLDHAARHGLARGPIQRFVAIQSSIVDLMGIVIEQEQPSASAAGILDQARASRRSATEIFAQIEANERAIAQLWLVRFTGESPGGGS